jgi:UDP-2-acetamido-3-amino-2,3-dideoxy-glucuronate N-acetyltransferase
MQNKQYNKSIAVIGSGYWGKNLIRNFSELGALHTICENNPDSLKSFSRKYPDIQVTHAYIDVLNTPEINAVVLATPAETHYSLAKAALLAQKDVFVEKPLALKVEEGQDLVRIAKENSQILMVGHLLHYHPAIIKVKELLQAGELGRIQYIYSNRLNLGKVRREENILWSFAPHDISVMLSLCEELPREVACFGGNYLHQQIADVTVCTLSFPSGIKGHIFVSWLHPVKEQRFVVVGSDKMIVFNDIDPTHKLLLYPHKIKWKGIVPLLDKKEAIPISIETDEPLKKECAHFMECIQNRNLPLTSGEEGLSVLQVLDAFQQSLENRGQLVGL